MQSRLALDLMALDLITLKTALLSTYIGTDPAIPLHASFTVELCQNMLRLEV